MLLLWYVLKYLESQQKRTNYFLQWLQSNQQVALFDNLFIRCSPDYLENASPLVILSVGAAVTASLATNVMERLTWLEVVFRSIDPRVSFR